MGAQVSKACCNLTGRGGILEEPLANAARAIASEISPEAAHLVDECLGVDTDGSRGVKVSQICAPLKGRHRSLLAGINYRGTQNELHGCVNDVRRMLPIIEKLGFPSGDDNQLLLLDEADQPREKMPTRANMLEAFRWLVDGAQTGDALFFHYSGHGGREPSRDPNASGSYNETLVPLDFEAEGMLLDTELFDVLVKKLPSGCRLTCILDSCHSAGALNLPFLFVGDHDELQKALAGQAIQVVMAPSWAKDLESLKDGRPQEFFTDAAHMGLALWQLKQQADASQEGDSTGFKKDEAENEGLAVGEVIAITGCRSDQTSADVGDVSSQFGLKQLAGGGTILFDKARSSGSGTAAGGALTTALVEALQDGVPADLTYFGVLEKIRQELSSKGFSQVPQLASSLVVDLNKKFELDSIFLPATESTSDSGKANTQSGDADSDKTNSQKMQDTSGAAAKVSSGCSAHPALDAFLQSMAAHPEGATMMQASANPAVA